jgi:hypothetical protein
MKIQSRFEQYFDKVDGCWEWTGALRGKGYGSFRIGRKTYIASRVSYELYKGSIEPGMLVCHTCNHPSCVNPEHLYLGTYSDNTKQAVQEGRQFVASGELNGQAKLTYDQVRAIRSDCRIQRLIAQDYSISQLHVSRIKRQLVWKDPQ